MAYKIDMNLKCQLLIRIVLTAWVCLMATAVSVLYQSHAEQRQRIESMVEVLAKQLQFQLQRIDAGFGEPQAFPNFELWQTFSALPGTCVSFADGQGRIVRSACISDGLANGNWPVRLGEVYQWLLRPDWTVRRPIIFKQRHYGRLSVSVSDKLAIAQAYASMKQLLGLSALTVAGVCLLVSFNLAVLLRPAYQIVAGLRLMWQGDLTQRLPDFALPEWRDTAAAINQLAESQQGLLQQRERLTLKLLTVQEQERRFLVRELHDEFGQCLAGINALAAGIRQTASEQCPDLLPETEQIGAITQQMMDNLRGLLLRLRPAELDELGLVVCLETLLQTWTARSQGKTHHRLQIHGACGQLPEPLPMTLYRIVQECLTNVAKHAEATEVTVALEVGTEQLTLQIADNGIATELLGQPMGFGLLGIRERVDALGGQLEVGTADNGGLIVFVRLPVMQAKVSSE